MLKWIGMKKSLHYMGKLEEICPKKSCGRREKNRASIEPRGVNSKNDHFKGRECGICPPFALCPVSYKHTPITHP
jgi:hypothetical protein